jgi:hypothetical protein
MDPISSSRPLPPHPNIDPQLNMDLQNIKKLLDTIKKDAGNTDAMTPTEIANLQAQLEAQIAQLSKDATGQSPAVKNAISSLQGDLQQASTALGQSNGPGLAEAIKGALYVVHNLLPQH